MAFISTKQGIALLLTFHLLAATSIHLKHNMERMKGIIDTLVI